MINPIKRIMGEGAFSTTEFAHKLADLNHLNNDPGWSALVVRNFLLVAADIGLVDCLDRRGSRNQYEWIAK